MKNEEMMKVKDEYMKLYSEYFDAMAEGDSDKGAELTLEMFKLFPMIKGVKFSMALVEKMAKDKEFEEMSEQVVQALSEEDEEA